ncbi:MAG: hypothetical protein FWF57_09425 [Defluviitaleaceae bacterium]|nr:hypothetical protein [Defluviitaleaceae bacterium]
MNTICIIDCPISEHFKSLYSDRITIINILSIKSDSMINQRGHGNAICEAFLSVNKDCEIIFFPVNNKTSIKEFNLILEYISDKLIARVVNISCGFISEYENKDILEMKYLCRVMYEKGIYIVAARDKQIQNVFPSKIDTVISVSVEDLKEILDINQDGIIINRKIYLNVYWDSNRRIWLNGSSIFCSIISLFLFEALNCSCSYDEIKELISSKEYMLKSIYNILNKFNFKINKRE